MHLPVPTRTPCDFSATPEAPARPALRVHAKSALEAVQPMLRFVINTPARLQLVFCVCSGRPTASTNSLGASAQEAVLGRDLGNERTLASGMTFQITFPLITMSHSSYASFPRDSPKQSGLSLSQPWRCSRADSNWIAKIAETDPREPLGSPQGSNCRGFTVIARWHYGSTAGMCMQP